MPKRRKRPSKGDVMKLTGVRLPESLLRRLKQLAEKWAADHPGARFTRADAIRMALEKVLTEEGL